MTHRHLITYEELLAAGALYVPPSWRKSLSAGTERDLFSDLVDDEDTPEKSESAVEDDSADDASDEDA